MALALRTINNGLGLGLVGQGLVILGLGLVSLGQLALPNVDVFEM